MFKQLQQVGPGCEPVIAEIVGTARTRRDAAEISCHGHDAQSGVPCHASRSHHYPGSLRIAMAACAEHGHGRLPGARDIGSHDLAHAQPRAPVCFPALGAAGIAHTAVAGQP